MATTYVLTALPHSVDPDDSFHVSVVVSPRLTPSGTLADFPVFVAWPDELATATLTVVDHTGVPFTTTPLPPDDPTRWGAVFPPETPVHGFVPQTFAGHEWFSYPAARMDQLAKAVHLVSLAADPIDPPLPSGSPLAVMIDRLSHQLWRDRDHPRGELGTPDEEHLTRVLDELIASRELPNLDPLMSVLVDLHRVRRFYERPESAQEYRERPTPGAPNDRPDSIEPDFHQRVALLGDHQTLLRELGLVVDVAITELDRLAQAQWLTARIVLADGVDGTVPTRVSCQIDEGVFTTDPRTSDWRAGRLRLGDATRFTLLDLDPDAGGLKLERFIVSLPRLADIERNSDPASAAPATLRAHGLAVARNGRVPDLVTHLSEHQARADALGLGTAPLLNTEDVNKGLRIEVWDDAAKVWFSLHLRSNQLMLGDGVAYSVSREEGFLQGASASQTPAAQLAPGTQPKTYLGETMFGWSGWSLSAPHPARASAFRYEGPQGDGPERTETFDEPTTPPPGAANVVSRPKVAAGTLPRLRYGRSYALRAWGVDLAANSPPRGDVLAPPGPGPAPVDEALAVAELSGRPPAPTPFADFVQLVRGEAARLDSAAAPSPPLDVHAAAASVATAAAELFVDDVHGPHLRTLLAGLVDERRRRHEAPRAIGRSERVQRSMRKLLDGVDPLVSVPSWSAAELAGLAAAAGGPSLAADTVTPLRQLLRWHPIEPPAVVPKHPFAEGESVRVLVIRSGVDVTADPDLGDTLALVDPATFAAQVAAAGIDYHDTCQRHLAPPKVSQPEAEYHGEFDDAIGSGDPSMQQAALLAARREAGSFLDRSIPSLTTPAVPITVDYLSLAASPDADPLQMVDLATLQPGDPLGPGQYLVADTEQLLLPYLPDPLATGISLRFPDAGRDRPAIAFPGGVEGVVARLHGSWPDIEPYRLVLRGGDAHGEVVGNVVDIALPPGEVVRARMASACDPDSLKLFGLWNLLPAALRGDLDIVQATADGWLWAFSPADEVRFVHAVPRPLEAPRPTTVLALRSPASTAVGLFGGVDLHGPTTVRLDAEASWTEWVDDPVTDGPVQHSFRATAFTTDVGPDEDLLFLGGVDFTLPVPGEGDVRFHASRHEYGDTKHRLVDYRFRGTSRFTEYFHPSLVATPADRSVVGPKLTLSIPSSARPPKPVVHDVVPLLRWADSAEPEQPFASRRSRRSGLRIYVDRSWYATGDDERLAVICAPTVNDVALDRKVSQWGADPVWRQKGPAVRPMLLELDHLFHQSGFDDRDRNAYPVGAARVLPLVDDPAQPGVTVLGYRPRFDKVRKLHYVDVAIEPGLAFWPFVRLVVARYQPDSLPGLHLSPTVRLDYSQVLPARTATISRVAAGRAHVVVSGPVGHRGPPDLAGDAARAAIIATRKLVARLEQRDPVIAGDLGWVTRDSVTLDLGGFDPSTWVAAWEATIEVPDDLPFERPGSAADWRITVEEFELFESDRTPPAPFIPEPRVIYADHLAL
jgi:hypothetical protein